MDKKLYKGFTSSTDLLPLFRYNYFSINPQDTTTLYTAVKPFEVIYNKGTNDVYFYYIYQGAIDEGTNRYLDGCICVTKEEAKRIRGYGYITTIKIEWEE